MRDGPIVNMVGSYITVFSHDNIVISFQMISPSPTYKGMLSNQDYFCLILSSKLSVLTASKKYQ
uniref:Uncharacterized protein n=1 Tax=Anguilla anguilla TaxID=7936 RepID=A0A0E9T2N6_ANGAN